MANLVVPTFFATDAISVGVAVLGGLALIWAIKKALELVGVYNKGMRELEADKYWHDYFNQ